MSYRWKRLLDRQSAGAYEQKVRERNRLKQKYAALDKGEWDSENAVVTINKRQSAIARYQQAKRNAFSIRTKSRFRKPIGTIRISFELWDTPTERRNVPIGASSLSSTSISKTFEFVAPSETHG